MPDLNGVQVTIVSDDQPLEEYEVTYEGDTATCWIPSEAGKVRNGRPKSFHFQSIDGDRLSGRVPCETVEC